MTARRPRPFSGERLPFADEQSPTTSLGARGASPATDHRPPTTDHRSAIPDPRSPVPGSRPPAADLRPPITAYIDGGSRGNPGPAGYGVRIVNPDGSVSVELHASIGIATNNVAEYQGLLAALRYAIDHGYSKLQVRSDSLLLVNQMAGRFKVKNPGLQVLHQQARALAERLARVSFVHVPRAQNADADRLANRAMDDAARGSHLSS